MHCFAEKQVAGAPIVAASYLLVVLLAASTPHRRAASAAAVTPFGVVICTLPPMREARDGGQTAIYTGGCARGEKFPRDRAASRARSAAMRPKIVISRALIRFASDPSRSLQHTGSCPRSDPLKISTQCATLGRLSSTPPPIIHLCTGCARGPTPSISDSHGPKQTIRSSSSSSRTG